MAMDEVRVVQHEDRLPWLETVEPDEVEGAPLGRVLAMVVLGLLILAATQALVGVWALPAPRAFYNGFPLPGHPWVALLPPYNEHLVRDVGAFNLALTVVLVAAAWTLVAFLVFMAYFALYSRHHLVASAPEEEFAALAAADEDVR